MTLLRQLPAIVILSLLCGRATIDSAAQPIVQYMGLGEAQATSLSINYGILAVGTNGHGVYWQQSHLASDTGWVHIPLDSLNILAVYAHKSGPLGWAISAGVAPEPPDTTFLYCSFLGEPFKPKSHGILAEHTTRIASIDGFPDPTICGETYAAGDRAIFRRTFGDTTWAPVFEASAEGSIVTVVAKEDYPGVVIAGGADGFAGHLLMKSTDFGDNWADISPIAFVNDVDFAGENGDVIFAAALTRIYRSRDGGDSWDVVQDEIDGSSLTHVLYDATTHAVYAIGNAHEGGPSLFFSGDDGDTWGAIQLPVSGRVMDVSFGFATDWIYFVTTEDGVYRVLRSSIPVSVENESELSDKHQLEQNFPNPFVGATTIEYSVASPTTAGVEIYNVLGQRVATWSARHSIAGDYSVTWDATGAAGGVYFYVLRTPASSIVRSMVVLE